MVRLLTALLSIALGLSSMPADAADPGHGRAVFASQCGLCHSDARGGPVVVGPPLYGVVGRPAGSLSGFNYSPAMKGAGFVWTAERLEGYLPAPRDYLPGVRMTYAGLKNPGQLEDLIAYLKTLK